MKSQRESAASVNGVGWLWERVKSVRWHYLVEKEVAFPSFSQRHRVLHHHPFSCSSIFTFTHFLFLRWQNIAMPWHPKHQDIQILIKFICASHHHTPFLMHATLTTILTFSHPLLSSHLHCFKPFFLSLLTVCDEHFSFLAKGKSKISNFNGNQTKENMKSLIHHLSF